jgi:anti-sigma regulatory factor (Ser/Thr protein kinase)
MDTRAPPPVGTLHVRLPLPGQPRDAAAARAFLRGVLTGRLPDETLDTAELLVSELVTNAIQHAGTELTVDIAHGPDVLRVAVIDGDPHLRPRRAADERGRGLTLIAALTQAWGVRDVPGGKQVWCLLTL